MRQSNAPGALDAPRRVYASESGASKNTKHYEHLVSQRFYGLT
jgi:hypothetical protein